MGSKCLEVWQKKETNVYEESGQAKQWVLNQKISKEAGMLESYLVWETARPFSQPPISRGRVILN